MSGGLSDRQVVQTPTLPCYRCYLPVLAEFTRAHHLAPVYHLMSNKEHKYQQDFLAYILITSYFALNVLIFRNILGAALYVTMG